MLAPERHHRIVLELESREAVRVTELAGALGVSEMTVRRDIETLDGRGLLRKIHGGASRIQAFTAVEPGFERNLDREQEAKAAIARAAVGLLSPGMTIALTGGSTTYQLAGQLGAVEGLTVVTNSLKVADSLYSGAAGGSGPAAGMYGSGPAAGMYGSGPGTATVIITGGERTPSEALVGPVATNAIRTLHFDMCFMGVHGIEPERGLSTPNMHEAETNRAFAASTSELVVLADHTKFGIIALAGILPLDDVDTLVTDRLPAGAAGDGYRKAVARILTTDDVATAPNTERSAAMRTKPEA
ncbi:DeoR/GlpR family DNA-binding transcription regulator [Arthrobacter monumenti]